MPEVAGQCLAKQERGKVKFHTSTEGSLRIRQWMDEHVSVCWTPDPDPGRLETALIAHYSLPLNLEYNMHHPFALELGLLRSKRRSEALPAGC